LRCTRSSPRIPERGVRRSGGLCELACFRPSPSERLPELLGYDVADGRVGAMDWRPCTVTIAGGARNDEGDHTRAQDAEARGHSHAVRWILASFKRTVSPDRVTKLPGCEYDQCMFPDGQNRTFRMKAWRAATARRLVFTDDDLHAEPRDQ